MEAEGALLLNKLKPNALGIALDSHGRAMDSVEFSQWMASLEQQGQDVAFVLGGSLGLSKQVLDACKVHLSLGEMTWPHQIARILVLEQLYRGYRIIHNEPYHK